MSQPALSISIKNLEEILGGSLIARSTRTLALTPEGQAFLPVAKRLLADWDEAFNDVMNMFSLQRGKLTIAAMPFFSTALLPDIFVEYQTRYPNINISLHDVINESVIDSVRSGRAELGICFAPERSDDLIYTELYEEAFIAVLPRDNPLAKKKKVVWSELFEYPFLALQQPASLTGYIREAMAQHDISMSVQIEAQQLSSIGKMVAAGLGVSVMPKSSAKEMADIGAFCLPLVKPSITQSVGIIHRNRYQLSVAASEMKQVITDVF